MQPGARVVKKLIGVAKSFMAITEAAAGTLLLASVAINFANIIGRYFFSVSIPWAEEIMLFLMIGGVFLICGVVGWNGGQIRMDAFVAMVPKKPRRWLELLADVALIATSIVLVVLAFPVVMMLAQFDQRSQAANFPLAIPQAMLPIGFVLMAVLVAIRVVTGAKTPTHDAPPSVD